MKWWLDFIIELYKIYEEDEDKWKKTEDKYLEEIDDQFNKNLIKIQKLYKKYYKEKENKDKKSIQKIIKIKIDNLLNNKNNSKK